MHKIVRLRLAQFAYYIATVFTKLPTGYFLLRGMSMVRWTTGVKGRGWGEVLPYLPTNIFRLSLQTGRIWIDPTDLDDPVLLLQPPIDVSIILIIITTENMETSLNYNWYSYLLCRRICQGLASNLCRDWIYGLTRKKRHEMSEWPCTIQLYQKQSTVTAQSISLGVVPVVPPPRGYVIPLLHGETKNLGEGGGGRGVMVLLLYTDLKFIHILTTKWKTVKTKWKVFIKLNYKPKRTNWVL